VAIKKCWEENIRPSRYGGKESWKAFYGSVRDKGGGWLKITEDSGEQKEAPRRGFGDRTIYKRTNTLWQIQQLPS
jgi:hypothetical protein